MSFLTGNSGCSYSTYTSAVLPSVSVRSPMVGGGTHRATRRALGIQNTNGARSRSLSNYAKRSSAYSVSTAPYQLPESYYCSRKDESFSAGRPSETNLNYKTLYEKERAENDRLRKEIDDIRKNDPNRLSYRFRNGSPATSSVLPVTRSASGASVEDVADRKSYEKRIAELEFQLKGMNQVKNENQRLKEENGALVRVISKMTI